MITVQRKVWNRLDTVPVSCFYRNKFTNTNFFLALKMIADDDEEIVIVVYWDDEH